MEAAADEIRLAANELEETSQFLIVAQRSAVPPVQVGHLLEGEILKRYPGSDIERRLVDVRDEKMRFGGVGNRQC